VHSQMKGGSEKSAESKLTGPHHHPVNITLSFSLRKPRGQSTLPLTTRSLYFAAAST